LVLASLGQLGLSGDPHRFWTTTFSTKLIILMALQGKTWLKMADFGLIGTSNLVH
jgi:hypothetical protein